MKRNGCFDRAPLADLIPVQNGWDAGLRRIEWIPAFGSRDCEYSKSTLGKADQGCTGCKWRASNV